MTDSTIRMESAAPLTAAMARTKLTEPGAEFEVQEVCIRGVPTRVWKNGPQTLLDLFDGTESLGAREFLVFEKDRVTYSAFRGAVGRLADYFSSSRILKGDRVAIVMPNRPEWVVAFFATVVIGAIAVPLNPNSSVEELEHAFALANPRLVICDLERVQHVAEALDRYAGEASIVVSRAAIEEFSARAVRLESLLGEIADWGTLPSPPPFLTRPLPEDDAVIFFTSGTTGKAKGVLTTHRACAYCDTHAAFTRTRKRLLANDEAPDLSKIPQPTSLLAVPLFHVSGIANSIIPMMAVQGKIVLIRHWIAELALRLIEREQVTVAGGVPVNALQLLEHPARGKYNISSIEQIVYGGAPSPVDLALQISKLKILPLQNWGMTETCGGVVGHLGREFEQRPASCGLPTAVHDLKIVDDRGAELPTGSPGHLLVKGPQIMKEYWRDPDLTGETLQYGWLRTGDIAYLDDEGYCFIVDRSKDMIICAGENIYCSEVEHILCRHPAVQEAAVLGISHRTFGEQPGAIVTLRSGAEIGESGLRAFAAQFLPNFKIPVRIVIACDPLPRNEMGKIRKNQLRTLFTR